MYTSGLVFTLSNDVATAESALRDLAAVGPFTLGDTHGQCRAAVMEASDPRTAHNWHDWAAALPGVESVEVVFVHWDEVEVPDAGA